MLGKFVHPPVESVILTSILLISPSKSAAYPKIRVNLLPWISPDGPYISIIGILLSLSITSFNSTGLHSSMLFLQNLESLAQINTSYVPELYAEKSHSYSQLFQFNGVNSSVGRVEPSSLVNLKCILCKSGELTPEYKSVAIPLNKTEPPLCSELSCGYVNTTFGGKVFS